MHSFFSLPHFPNLEPRVFGCTVYVHIPNNLRTKLDPCAKRCVFVGYSEFQKGYRCYDLCVTLDASFRETEPYYSRNFSGPSLQGETYTEENGLQRGGGGNEFIELEKVNTWLEKSGQQVFESIPGNDNDVLEQLEMPADAPDMAESSKPLKLPTFTPSPEESTQNVLPQVTSNPSIDESNEIHDSDRCIALKYSQRSNKGTPKKQYEPGPKAKIKYPISNHVSSHRLSRSYAFTINQLFIVSIPSNVQDALANPKWIKAMNEEMEALQKNAT